MMNRFLAWLWFRHEDGTRVVKAFDWTEMLVDRKIGGRQHIWIMNPCTWLLGRIIDLPVVAWEQEWNDHEK